jgi:stage II sporulation protein D
VISAEPLISIGILENVKEAAGALRGTYELHNSVRLTGAFRVASRGDVLILYDDENIEAARASELRLSASEGSAFTLDGITIGKNFHWEKKESQTFEGDIRFVSSAGGITAINSIGIERYLKSVISSEMSAEAPVEFLRAHAITSRSWLAAMLERKKLYGNTVPTSVKMRENKDEIIRWYDREDHTIFDVCADDHCQRYQGVAGIISESVGQAVAATQGVFLVHGDRICDARFSKACGGRTELFGNCWEEIPVPYLESVSDSPKNYPPVLSEKDAEEWILSSPDAYCNTSSGDDLRRILPSFDRKTADFFRWKAEYSREELEEIIGRKSGIDFGTLKGLVPVQRGPSGRIYKLRIVGTKKTIEVGKELEIRRWLSRSHLYSSAFIVKTECDAEGVPEKFLFQGAGWGHGVGLCQIGAASMALKGMKSEDILKHYFTGVELKKLY